MLIVSFIYVSDRNFALLKSIMTTIQSMVVNVDTNVNEIQIEVQEMKAEILDIKEKMQSSKCEVLEVVDRKVECKKEEIVNALQDKLKKFDKISEMKKEVEMTVDNVKNEVLKIVTSQNTLSSSVKDAVKNLPQKDVLMEKHELSQSLAEIKQSINRNKPMDKEEMVGHLKQIKDVVEQLPKQGQIMTKPEIEQHFNDVKEKITG